MQCHAHINYLAAMKSVSNAGITMVQWTALSIHELKEIWTDITVPEQKRCNASNRKCFRAEGAVKAVKAVKA
jgi:hypothetical protein